MAQDALLTIRLADPDLLASTLDDYIEQIEAATDRCYECDGGAYCPAHQSMVREMEDDFTALALGMICIEVA